MKKNMGSADQGIRLLLAATLVVLYFSGVISGTFGMITLVIAAVFMVTTLVGYCPMYSLIGVKTCKVKEG
jgi:K+-transporting ATPase A subunit